MLMLMQMKAIMAEKPMVSEAEPRKPRREPSMHKMRTREPAPAEAHAAAHGAEMHAPSPCRHRREPMPVT